MSSISLPAKFDKGSVAAIVHQMREAVAEKKAITLDGSAVSQIGIAALQSLVSARETAKEMGLKYTLTSPSERLVESIKMCGANDILESNQS